MRHLTAKQRKFIATYVRTGQAAPSAVEAGYAPADARSRACKLLKTPAVKSEIDRLTALANTTELVGQQEGRDQRGEPPSSNDPLDYLRWVMNDHREDPRLRLEAAKALASFTVPKPAARGKKQEREEAARGASRGKFRPSAPPGAVLPFPGKPKDSP